MTDLPNISLYRRATIAGLLIASVLFLADNAIHPKEYSPDHEVAQLHSIGDNYTRWQLAHVLGVGTIFFFTVAVLGLAFMVRRRAPSLGLWGGGLAVAGMLGLAMIIGLDGYSWAIVGEVSSRGTDTGTAALVLHDLQQSNWSYAYYLPSAGFVVGMLLLTVGMVRTRAVATWIGVVFGIGVLLVGLEGTIHANAFFIAGAAVLAVGSCCLAAAIAAMTTNEFATGGQALP